MAEINTFFLIYVYFLLNKNAKKNKNKKLPTCLSKRVPENANVHGCTFAGPGEQSIGGKANEAQSRAVVFFLLAFPFRVENLAAWLLVLPAALQRSYISSITPERFYIT